jgi:hypothetical protein
MLLRQQGLMWLCNVSLAVSVAFSVRMPKAEGFKWVYPEERKLKNDCVLIDGLCCCGLYEDTPCLLS